MKKRRAWCLCLMAWLILFAAAAGAETRFDALCRAASLDSPDAVAWLEIPGAQFNQPVFRHPQDDTYYSAHDHRGEVEGGALYTQAKYNAGNFSDPVTVIYGSSSSVGTPLRNLQEMYSGSFGQCRQIRLHTPEGTREYAAFAAVPYSSIHILHYYDFTQPRRYTNFFDGVFSLRKLGMQLDESFAPEPEDQVIILSTGLRGDNTQRYLVMAKLVQIETN